MDKIGVGEIVNETLNETTDQETTETEDSSTTYAGSEAGMHSEGEIALTIEEQTAKLPSDLFLWAAVGSIAASLILELSGKEEKSRFVGQWVSPFLLLGVYNKLVKIGGSDRVR